MASVTQRSTKAEILAELHELESLHANGPTWAQVWSKLASTAKTVSREGRLLVIDTYKAGALVRQWVSAIVGELSRPVLRSKA